MAGRGTVVINIVGDVSDLQSKLKQGSGDLDKFGNNVSSTGDRLTGVGSKLTLGLTGPLVAGFSLAAKAAADEGQEMAILENTLRNAAGATDAQVAATEEWITATQNATGVSDGQLRPALAKLLIAGRSVEQAQRDMAVALDIAAARGVDVETVTQAMAQANAGQTRALGKLVGATKDASGETLTFDQLMLRAADTMGGAAADAADTAAGRAAIMQAKMADLSETIGTAVIPVMEKVVGGVAAVADGFTELPGPAQTGVLALAGIAAASGPILTVVGNVQKLVAATKAVDTAALVSKGAMFGVAGAIAAVGVAATSAAESLDSKMIGLIEETAELTGGELVDAFREAGESLGWFESIAKVNVGTAVRLRDALKEQGEETDGLDAIIDEYVQKQKNIEASSAAATGAVQGETLATEDLGVVAEDTTESLTGLLDATLALFDADLSYEQQVNRTEDAIRDLNEATAEVMKTKGKDREATEAMERATLDAAEAILSQASAAGELASKNSGLTDETGRSAVALRTQKEELERVRDTLAPGSPLRVRLDEYIFKLAELDGQHVVTTIETRYVGRNDGGGPPVVRKDARPDKGGANGGGWSDSGFITLNIDITGAVIADRASAERFASLLAEPIRKELIQIGRRNGGNVLAGMA